MSTQLAKFTPGFRNGVIGGALLLAAIEAQAFSIDTNNSQLKLRWDNTLKYSNAYRLEEPSPGLNTPDDNNQNDGNQNFDTGLVSNRLDLLSELDITYKNLGVRFSGAAWYDDVYHQDTDNGTVTSNSLQANQFPEETKEIMGEKAELLDAFVFARIPINDATATVRLGRHTILWGESLFFGSNGIAGGMAPVDLVKLLSVPNSQFKETVRPLGKFSANIPINERVTVSTFIGYEWEKSRLMPAGAFLSSSDVLEGERIISAPLTTFAPTFERRDDIEPSDSGQYGLSLRWSSADFSRDYGLYAIRYHAFDPSTNLLALSAPPTVAPESYRWVYHEGIEAYGMSLSGSVGVWSLAGEVSYRQNTVLASKSPEPSVGGNVFNNTDNLGYAVGSSAHAQFNWLASLGPSFISREASFLGEIAWNTRVDVDENEELLNPNADKSSVAARLIYSPTYRQLFSGLDVTPSVGLGYTHGASSAVGTAFGVNKGGDFNLGVSMIYRNQFKFSLRYITYLGKEGGSLDAENRLQFKQSLKDRDFVSFSLSTTF